MIIALTGATGFLGGHVLTALLAAGHAVRALTRRPQDDRANVTWVSGALDNRAALETLVTGADAVVHVAGVVNAPDAAAFDAGNRAGTQAMVDAALSAGVGRFVHISSLAVREPQLSHYGASKLAAENAVRASPLDWHIVQPPAIYGPGDTDNLELFRLAKQGFMPLPPPGRLSLIHATDLAELIVAMAQSDTQHSCYQADDGAPAGWTHRDYARAIGAAIGRNPVTLSLPQSVLRIGAWLDTRIRGDNAKLTPDRVAYFCHPDWVIDAACRPPVSLWAPRIDTHTGLADTAAWYRQNNWL